jgi:hypothetical protein
MNKFYVLDFKVFDKDYYAEKVSVSHADITELSIEGISLIDSKIEIELKKNKGEVRNYIGNLYSLPIVSELIAKTIMNHNFNDIELIEVKVNMKTDLKYYFLNILNVIDCIDLEKSIYKLYVPEIILFDSINKLVIDTAKIKNDIFRIKGVLYKIIVSERLKIELENLNLDEIEFMPIEDFTKE